MADTDDIKTGLPTDQAGAPLILKAALEAFRKTGFHGTSIRAIAKRAGVSIALIYYHYPNKEEILRTLMLNVTADLEAELVRARDAAGEQPSDRLAAMVRVHVRFHTERQAESFVANTELRALGEENRRTVVRGRDAIAALYAGVISDGVSDGVFSTDAPHEANLAILNMCTAVAGWYRPDGPKSPAELAEDYVGFTLSLLGC